MSLSPTTNRGPLGRTLARPLGSLWALIAGAALGICVAASARAQSQVMVMDDGGGPMVMHFTGPDIRDLKEPDYRLDDLATFREELRLADTQTEIVRERLKAYVEAFMAMAREKLTAIDPHAFHEGGRVVDGPDADGPNEFAIDLGGPGMLDDLDIDLDGPGEVMIAITAGGGPGGNFVVDPENAGGGTVDVDVDVAGGADADVVVAIDGPDGLEIPDELREKLEAEAEKIAEKIREQMENGEVDLAAPIGAPGDVETRMERHREHFERISALAEEFEAAKEKLRREFVTDVQAKLEDPQLERWPNLDRALTRIKTLPKGRLDGERTDLLEVLEEVAPGVKSAPQIAEQREAYEVTLHDALVRRNAFLEDADRKIDEAMKASNADKALSVIDRATQLRIGVRLTNERFASVFEDALEAEAADEFRRRVLEVSYPRVYRKNTGLRAFEEARRLDGLTEDALLGILDLESPYRAELELMNTKLKRIIDTHQPLQARRGIEHMRRVMDGDRPEPMGADDPIRAAFDERRALDERYMKILYESLTPEQVATLPDLPSKRKRGPIMIRRSGAEPF